MRTHCGAHNPANTTPTPAQNSSARCERHRFAMASISDRPNPANSRPEMCERYPVDPRQYRAHYEIPSYYFWCQALICNYFNKILRNIFRAPARTRRPRRRPRARARPRRRRRRRPRVDSEAKCNPVDSIGSSTKSRVSHSERRPSARFPGDKDGSARRNTEPLQ